MVPDSKKTFKGNVSTDVKSCYRYSPEYHIPNEYGIIFAALPLMKASFTINMLVIPPEFKDLVKDVGSKPITPEALEILQVNLMAKKAAVENLKRLAAESKEEKEEGNDDLSINFVEIADKGRDFIKGSMLIPTSLNSGTILLREEFQRLKMNTENLRATTEVNKVKVENLTYSAAESLEKAANSYLSNDYVDMSNEYKDFVKGLIASPPESNIILMRQELERLRTNADNFRTNTEEKHDEVENLTFSAAESKEEKENQDYSNISHSITENKLMGDSGSHSD